MITLRIVVLAAVAAVCLAWHGLAAAADIRVLSSNGLKEVLHDIAPDFERSSGHKLVMEFDSANGVKRKVEAGAACDVAITTPVLMADLVKQGKVASGTAFDIARVGLGAAVRTGTPKPDIGTTSALRQTLLNAKSVMYNKDGQSGIYMAGLMERLGIAEQMRSRTILKTVPGPVAENIARGEAEIGFQLISEILSVPGVELVGPLPADVQTFVVLAGAMVTGSPAPAAAGELLRFLATPASAQVMKKHGMEAMAR